MPPPRHAPKEHTNTATNPARTATHMSTTTTIAASAAAATASPSPSPSHSHLLSLPPEILALILSHLFHPVQLTITARPTTGTVTVESDPPVKPLMLVCRALRREAPWVARRAVRGVCWDFDLGSREKGRVGGAARWVDREVKSGWPWNGGGGGGGGGLGVQRIREMLPGGVTKGVREVEVCVPPVNGLCGGCLVRWLGELVGLGNQVERVLVRVGVKRVCVGEWARLESAVARGQGLEEVLGCWGAMSGLVQQVVAIGDLKRKTKVLVEVAFMCDVRMACLRQEEECGAVCFGNNFMYCVIDVEYMKVLESKVQRCARTAAAQELHQAHVKYMAAKRDIDPSSLSSEPRMKHC